MEAYKAAIFSASLSISGFFSIMSSTRLSEAFRNSSISSSLFAASILSNISLYFTLCPSSIILALSAGGGSKVCVLLLDVADISLNFSIIKPSSL